MPCSKTCVTYVRGFYFSGSGSGSGTMSGFLPKPDYMYENILHFKSLKIYNEP